MRRYIICLMFFAAMVMFFTSSALAAGVNPLSGFGTRGKSMGAGTAVSNDAGCFFYNLAGLGQADDFVQAGFDVLDTSFTYKDPFGKEYESDTVYFIPSAGVNYRVNKKATVGLGIITPYSFGSDFESDFGLLSKLSLTEMVMAGTYEFGDFTVGLGLNAGMGKIKLIQPFYASGMNLGSLKSDADGYGYGWQAGILYQPNDWLNVGLSYQSKIKVDLSGDSRLKSAILGNASDDFSADFYFPSRLGFGLGLELGKWLIAADYICFDYSSNDSVNINYKNWPDNQMVLDWENVNFFALGAEYSIQGNWKLRGGLIYQNAAIPDLTCNPLTPDADGYGASLGFGWVGKNLKIDATYSKAWTEKRKVGSAYPAPGEYNMDINIYSFAVSWLF